MLMGRGFHSCGGAWTTGISSFDFALNLFPLPSTAVGFFATEEKFLPTRPCALSCPSRPPRHVVRLRSWPTSTPQISRQQRSHHSLCFMLSFKASASCRAAAILAWICSPGSRIFESKLLICMKPTWWHTFGISKSEPDSSETTVLMA